MLKPFIKWAGGKGQLLNNIRQYYPEELGGHVCRYCEPFVGGGAVLLDILNNYSMDEIYINDINAELINTYKIIQQDVQNLIDRLEQLQSEFLPLNKEKRKEYYYLIRERFNYEKNDGNKFINIDKAAMFLFLNRTCFNGLYRVNGKGLYNVPMGSYKNPMICDKNNLLSINKALQKVQINCGDYKESLSFINENTFVYVDPPYRPLNETAKFTAYAQTLFNDKHQIELAEFVHSVHKIGAYVVISNSDPKNINKNDNFFEDLYGVYNIERVNAKRMINCNGSSRGHISELLICNY